MLIDIKSHPTPKSVSDGFHDHLKVLAHADCKLLLAFYKAFGYIL